MGGDFDKTEINKEEKKYSFKDKKFFQKISEKKFQEYFNEGDSIHRIEEPHRTAHFNKAKTSIEQNLKRIQKILEAKAEMGYYNLDLLVQNKNLGNGINKYVFANILNTIRRSGLRVSPVGSTIGGERMSPPFRLINLSPKPDADKLHRWGIDLVLRLPESENYNTYSGASIIWRISWDSKEFE